MNSKIFRSNFITSLLVLIVTIILIFGVLFEYFENQLTNELKSEATYISHALENEGEEYIDNFKNDWFLSIFIIQWIHKVIAL